jgi:hypothetical protein
MNLLNEAALVWVKLQLHLLGVAPEIFWSSPELKNALWINVSLSADKQAL